MRAHLRTNSCDKIDRVDFSQGITSEQEKDLKTRRTTRNAAQEDHWKVVFRIVFPEHQGDIPSSTCEFPHRFSRFAS
jgi:hypothetical protein